ncbi:hypothetical protein ACTXK0_04700 [Corynebacterium variabile]|uniref:hypothetical protein n=1 Tax=Corynebacterium variabile TaxID=1727 RepID=UPI003FD52390
MDETNAAFQAACATLDWATAELHRWAEDLRGFSRWVAYYDPWSHEEVLDMVGGFRSEVGRAPAAVQAIAETDTGVADPVVVEHLGNALDAVSDALLAGAELPGMARPLLALARQISAVLARQGVAGPVIPEYVQWTSTMPVDTVLRLWDWDRKTTAGAEDRETYRQAIREWDEELTKLEHRRRLRGADQVNRQQRREDPVLIAVDWQRVLLRDSKQRFFEITGELDDLLVVLADSWYSEQVTRMMLLELAGRREEALAVLREIEEEGDIGDFPSSGCRLNVHEAEARENGTWSAGAVVEGVEVGVPGAKATGGGEPSAVRRAEALMKEALVLTETHRGSNDKDYPRAAVLVREARDLLLREQLGDRFDELLRELLDDECTTWYIAAVLGEIGIGPCINGLEPGFRPKQEPWQAPFM